MNRLNWKLLLTLFLVVGFTVFVATYALPRALVTLTKASGSGNLSLSDSYLIGGKLLASADGKDQAIVSVFLRDKDGKAVDNKQVSLEGVEGIEPAVAKPDSNGQTSFKISSTKAGQFTITALVSGIPLPKTLIVTFR